MAHRLSASAAIRLIAIVVLLLSTVAPLTVAAQGDFGNPIPKSSNGIYIVRMADPTVLSYRGGIGGIPAPRVAAGQRPDRNEANAKAYARYLIAKHDAALRAVNALDKVYDYTYTFNGFAARISREQAEALRGQPGVISVEADEIRVADTITTPSFLGLDKPGGLWAQLGGPARAGEGIIIGVIDSGIWPENPSFADDGTYRPLARWKGSCVDGEEWTDLCNNKLIGAKYFNAGQGGNAGIDASRPWEFNSPRDYNGHGSHTSSTSGGNYKVPVVIEGNNLGLASGMAPRARVAMYKALWSTQAGDTASGTTSDLVAAIDEATADGVDVINYSISGSTTSITSPDEIAFLEAASQGVFVSASAGNSGPTASTVAHNSPWLMTVAAGTHDRGYDAVITLGDGSTYHGVSVGNGTPMLPVIKSVDAGLAGANATAVRLCYAAIDNGGVAVLDPAKVTGKIVQCDRGTNARVNKSLAVKDAGGLGVILTNVSPASLNADFHSVPTIHTDEVAGAAIKAYITSAGAAATAQLGPAVILKVEAPTVASFSSQGPALARSGNLLKPDIMAPGVDVLAAVAPTYQPLAFNLYSGTSMAAPHIAGIAALIKQRQPAWTPDMIKSAMITTASTKTNFGNPLAGNPFGYGAGQVNPTAAANPGLVYKIKPQDYLAFLCGQGLLTGNLCAIRNISIFDLNLPSIAAGSLAGDQTWTRTVTNVTNKTATYTAAVNVPGFTAVVTPATLTVKAGASATFTLKLTRTTAPLNAYAFGDLVWTSGSFKVRSPIAVRPVAVAVASAFVGAGTSGSGTVSLKFGYDGPFSAAPHGLVAATTLADTINTGETKTFDVVVPAGTKLARFSLFDDKTTAPDLDLEVYLGSSLRGSSGGSTSEEQVDLANPAAGTYTVHVVGFDTGGGPATFKAYGWAVPVTDQGNLTVTVPATAVIATTASGALDWSGLNADTRYLGIVTYHNVAAPTTFDDGRIGLTYVRIDTD